VKSAWRFIAGDSRSTPLAVACAVAVAVVGTHSGWPNATVASAYAGILVAGLTLGVFERP
jgi:hypothetical protein